MSRKRGCVERGVTAALLAGVVAACASPPPPSDPEAGGPPEGVDYIMAVQCAGLGNAIRTFQPDFGRFGDGARMGERFAVWAQQVSGAKWEVVQADIEASRRDFVTGAGKGANEVRVARIRADYGAPLGVCETLADLPDRVFVGG